MSTEKPALNLTKLAFYLRTPRPALPLAQRIEQVKIYKSVGRELPGVAEMRTAMRQHEAAAKEEPK